MRIHQLLRDERRRQRGRLAIAALSATVLAAASVLLLALSGWFITSAALAGLAGLAAATAFNVLLPSATIRLLAILRTFCRYTERLSGHDAAFRALARIRPALYRAIAAGPPGLAFALSTGEAVARMTQDVDEMEIRFIQQSALWGAVSSTVTGLAVLLLAGPVAAASLVTIVVALVIAVRRVAAAIQPLGEAVPRANGGLKDEFATLVAAAPELCAYGLEGWAAERIDMRAQALVRAQQLVTAASGWFDVLPALAMGLAAMLALALTNAALPVAALAALAATMAVDGVTPYLRGLQRQGHLHAAEGRLETMLHAPTPELTIIPAGRAPTISLPGFGTTLPPGTIAGLIGPSGCGKTTLLEQMVRLRDPVRGQILLAGIDLADLDPDCVRTYFAHAPQDAALLSGSVRDNLAMAAPDATDAAMWDALRDAALEDRVAALSRGLDSWIGENGVQLSGGERRRLSLARALLRPAPWLLLDEPTEGLDNRTETIVVERLQARLAAHQQGALIISHRPLPLGCCDVVLDYHRVAMPPAKMPAPVTSGAAY